MNQESTSRVIERLLYEAGSVMERLEHNERRVLATVLRRDHTLRVDEVFPRFRRGSDGHQILRTLRRRQLLRPGGSGSWRPEKDIVLKPFGRILQSLDESGLLGRWLGEGD